MGFWFSNDEPTIDVKIRVIHEQRVDAMTLAVKCVCDEISKRWSNWILFSARSSWASGANWVIEIRSPILKTQSSHEMSRKCWYKHHFNYCQIMVCINFCAVLWSWPMDRSQCPIFNSKWFGFDENWRGSFIINQFIKRVVRKSICCAQFHTGSIETGPNHNAACQNQYFMFESVLLSTLRSLIL